VVVGLGCSPAPPRVVAETEHFRYRVQEGLPVCQGSIDWLEVHYRSITAWLGIELPAGDQLDYSYVDNERLDRYCPSSAAGCAYEEEAFASSPLERHELVHLYSNLIGHPPLFFREGLATLLGCAPRIELGLTEIPRSREILSMFSNEGFEEPENRAEAYLQAAAFTGFLIERYGKEAALAFYGRLPSGAGNERTARELEEHFGESADAMVDAWLASPPQTPDGLCAQIDTCAAPPLGPWPGGTETLACGAFSNYLRQAIRTFDVTERSMLRLGGSATIAWNASVFACAGTQSFQINRRSDPGAGELWFALDPDRYRVYLNSTESFESEWGSEPVTVEAGVTVVPNLLAEQCADVTPQALHPDTAWLTIRDELGAADDEGEPGLVDYSLAFELARPRTMRVVSGYASGDPGYVRVCEGGCPSDPSATCVGAPMIAGSDEPTFALAASVPYRVVIDVTSSGMGQYLDLELDPPP
jgi:hypothetical protein